MRSSLLGECLTDIPSDSSSDCEAILEKIFAAGAVGPVSSNVCHGESISITSSCASRSRGMSPRHNIRLTLTLAVEALHLNLRPFLRLERPVRRLPHRPAECKSRMHRRQANDSNRDHQTIQNQEVRLIVPQLSLKTLPQLNDTEDRSDQHNESCKEQTPGEDLVDASLSDPLLVRAHIELALTALPPEIHKDPNESRDGDSLQE